jgi:hypothetical protein
MRSLPVSDKRTLTNVQSSIPAVPDAHAVRHDGDAVQAGLAVEEHNVAVLQMPLHSTDMKYVCNTIR